MIRIKLLNCWVFLLLIVVVGYAGQPQLSQAIYLYTLIGDANSTIRLKNARALSVDLLGSIYVADTGNNRILKFDRNGELIKTVGGFGWEKDQFYYPYDIHASSALDIFVADYENQRLQRYDRDLNYISSLYSSDNWAPPFQFGYPGSVASSVHGDLFLIDSENIRVLKLNSFGEPEASFGDYAEGKGRLLQPAQLAVSPNDQLYISDSKANKIIVFDYFGNYLAEIGSDFLKEPQGIFYHPLNLLLVADTGNKRIVIFSPEGNLILVWMKISDERDSFQNPIDVVSFQRKVFVLDNDRILAYEIK